MNASMGKTIVVFTASPWNEPKRLRRQLTEVLSHDTNVVYVTLPYGMRKPTRSSDQQDGRVRVLTLAGPPIPLRLLACMPALRALYGRFLARQLKRKLENLDELGTLLCFTPIHPDVIAHFSATPLIYVANDDHALMAGSAAAARTIAHDETRIIAQSRCILSVSEAIAHKLAPSGKPIFIIYPGHDCHVRPIQSFKAEMRQVRSACFFGYIDWRIDFALLRLLLDHGWQVTLIGPIIGTDQKVAELQALFPDHFDVHPPMATAEVPELLARYEVLIIPYRFYSAQQAEVIEMPNKIFVYFSALRPIVTTSMPNLRFVEPGLIYQATTHEEFIAKCLQAVDDDSIDHAARRAQIAQENSWAARRTALYKLMSDAAVS